jgi:hypothetical protein
MNKLRAIAIFFLTALLHHAGQAQSAADGATPKVRIKNESKFLIIKLTILDKTFENIKPGGSSEFVDIEPFYPSMKVVATVQRKRIFGKDLWYHVITYPIDHVGEKRITNGKSTIVISFRRGEEKGQLDVDTHVNRE